jgi:hypothetical protein
MVDIRYWIFDVQEEGEEVKFHEIEIGGQMILRS